MFVSDGLVEVNAKEVSVLADVAEYAENIDEALVEQAKKRAEEILEKKEENIDFAKIEANLRRELMRLKVSKKYKK